MGAWKLATSETSYTYLRANIYINSYLLWIHLLKITISIRWSSQWCAQTQKKKINYKCGLGLGKWSFHTDPSLIYIIYILFCWLITLHHSPPTLTSQTTADEVSVSHNRPKQARHFDSSHPRFLTNISTHLRTHILIVLFIVVCSVWSGPRNNQHNGLRIIIPWFLFQRQKIDKWINKYCNSIMIMLLDATCLFLK